MSKPSTKTVCNWYAKHKEELGKLNSAFVAVSFPQGKIIFSESDCWEFMKRLAAEEHKAGKELAVFHSSAVKDYVYNEK